MRVLAVFLLTAWSLFAQSFHVDKETTLSGSAEVITIQQPASGAKTVRGDQASVYMSADCPVQIEHTGTAATVTAMTVAKIDPQGFANTALAFSGSDVGAGTVIGRQVVKGGATFLFDLSQIVLRGNFNASTNKANFSIRTDSCTGTALINVYWKEQ